MLQQELNHQGKVQFPDFLYVFRIIFYNAQYSPPRSPGSSGLLFFRSLPAINHAGIYITLNGYCLRVKMRMGGLLELHMQLLYHDTKIHLLLGDPT